jgi:hypothetical protein
MESPRGRGGRVPLGVILVLMVGLLAVSPMPLEPAVAQELTRARLLQGEHKLAYERYSREAKKTVTSRNEIRATGSADFAGFSVEAALKVDVRATKDTLLEDGPIAGLRGICQILVDGDEGAPIKMSTGRMEVSLLGGLLDAGMHAAMRGEPDPAVVSFGRDSNKAEWTKTLSLGSTRATVLVRFVYREATDSLLYYVFVERL